MNCTYGALVRLFTRVPAHVNDEHVLSLERFLVARTLAPAADKALFVCVDVVVVDVLDEVILSGEFLVAVAPVAVCLDKISRFILHRVHRITRAIVAVIIHWFDDTVVVLLLLLMMQLVTVVVMALFGRRRRLLLDL